MRSCDTVACQDSRRHCCLAPHGAPLERARTAAAGAAAAAAHSTMRVSAAALGWPLVLLGAVIATAQQLPVQQLPVQQLPVQQQQQQLAPEDALQGPDGAPMEKDVAVDAYGEQ